MYIGLNRDRVTTILYSVLAELYEKISGQFDEVRVSVFLPLSLNNSTQKIMSCQVLVLRKNVGAKSRSTILLRLKLPESSSRSSIFLQFELVITKRNSGSFYCTELHTYIRVPYYISVLYYRSILCVGTVQGWASVLFKRTFRSLRSFLFFIKERSDLCVLFRSL